MVTDGDYSEYRICSIHSTKDRAEYAKRLFNTFNDIEEYVIDAVPPHPHGYLLHFVAIDREGNCNSIEIISVEQHDRIDWCPLHGGFVGIRVWAKDDKHAVKVANERRIQMIASNEWTTDYTAWHNKHVKAFLLSQQKIQPTQE